MTDEELIAWLLEGDVSIQYQARRDLLHDNEGLEELQAKIEKEGWGAKFLARRHPDGHWGDHFYQPKWTSSHYTLLDLKNLNVSKQQPLIQKSIRHIATEQMISGLQAFRNKQKSLPPNVSGATVDVCVNGMFLNYATYFQIEQALLHDVVDFLLSQQMQDGGFNCRSTRCQCQHSSLHSTISVLEGIVEYEQNGYKYRLKEMQKAGRKCIEFLFKHSLFQSCTRNPGMTIHKDFLRLTYPSRWKYDILRALDCLQHANVPYDERMQPALDVLVEKRRPSDRTWPLQAKHPGKQHFEMERAGKPSRWNTLRALRVLQVCSPQIG
mmetsp:Transcript_4446/g.8206  ORF Transcript_4446/g.8206 Transcript_4446/m.8206 type:complete len:324 (+) Transcript_4446:89-1060(+)